ncbi:hypothetical protein RintRC_2808 [Richelia intracellularis]|nr:hypothetical protein RintRC_2808 [Richelia intracellularis]
MKYVLIVKCERQRPLGEYWRDFAKKIDPTGERFPRFGVP